MTDRGKTAAIHAIEMARAHLAGSARCLEMEAMLPFEVGLDLSLEDTIKVTHESIPGGTLRGKLVAYRLTQEGDQASCWIRVLISLGTQDARELTDREQDEGAEEYVTNYAREEKEGEARASGAAGVGAGEEAVGEAGGGRLLRTPSGILYADYKEQKPLLGILHPETLRGRNLLQHLELRGHPEEQYAYVKERQYPLRDDLEAVLGEIPTRIHFHLQDLRTAEELVHSIYLVIPEAWSAPKQIECG